MCYLGILHYSSSSECFEVYRIVVFYFFYCLYTITSVTARDSSILELYYSMYVAVMGLFFAKSRTLDVWRLC